MQSKSKKSRMYHCPSCYSRERIRTPTIFDARNLETYQYVIRFTDELTNIPTRLWYLKD